MPKILLTLIFGALLFSPATSPRAETLVLNNTGSPPLTSEFGTGVLDIIAREAFRRNGLNLSLIKVPAERGITQPDVWTFGFMPINHLGIPI